MGRDETIQVDAKTDAVFKRKGYIVLKKISEGAFGEVYKAKNVKRGEMDAVKVMDLKRVAAKGMEQKYLDREIKALVDIKHPNVLKVNDIFRAKGKLYIFMEFAPNGTLKQKVKEAPGRYLKERQAKHWFKQCVDALCCMHGQHRMAHRDIKLDNVLLDQHDNAKLSDFGFTREFNLEGRLATTYCGTEPYYAPEILSKTPYNPFLYDVWSMGVMLFIMLNGRLPFRVDKKHRMECVKEMKRLNYNTNPAVWDLLTDEVKDLIGAMFIFNPDQRPNILAVREHPWFGFN